MIKLTEEQLAVAKAVQAWYSFQRRQQFTVGGYAGTGKTVLIKHLLDTLSGVKSVSAFTGKAVHVLRNKGVDCAQTIHSLIYDVDDGGRFTLKPRLDCDFVIVDEASMVPTNLYRDLLSFGLPVLFVGDMGQLEPIGDDPRLMANPDAKLETIHRQAAENPIIEFSANLRRGLLQGRQSEALALGDYSTFLRAAAAGSVDQLLCGFNKTRCTINACVREARKHTGLLCPGERVICLKNNRAFGVFNGLMAEVVAVEGLDKDAGVLWAKVRIDESWRTATLPMVAAQFGAEAAPREAQNNATYWDYGYAITVHKSQGSQWDSVAVYEEVSRSWDWKRWTYTAATRAAKQLIYCR